MGSTRHVEHVLPGWHLEDRGATDPGCTEPTSIYEIARLDRLGRDMRQHNLLRMSAEIVNLGIEKHVAPRELAGTVVMYSGGNDSTILAHMFRHDCTHAFHANTGIGIERTRQFVRDTCAEWQLPLIEKHPGPGDTYEELVTAQGFPGPPRHDRMYQRLKEKQERQARRELVQDGRKQRALFIGGRRRAESDRRKWTPLVDRVDSMVKVTPLALWTKLDMRYYRLTHPGVPLNPVSVALGMSGECLCGAYAKPGELDRVRQIDDAAAAEIDRLTCLVRAAGHRAPYDTWGHGNGKHGPSKCGECSTIDGDPLLDILDPTTAGVTS